MSDACTSSSPFADSGEEPPSTGPPSADAAGQREAQPRPPRVGVVGVCGSGKSTLVAGLRALGIEARQIDQEHSYVPDLWRRFSEPDVLVYLEASDATIEGRIGPLLHKSILPAQRQRLVEARSQAQVHVDTDGKSAEEVLHEVLVALAGLPLAPRSESS